jgi:putative hydrolase of the HAD superfamily
MNLVQRKNFNIREGDRQLTMIKAIIFDLDGTLLNRDASIEMFVDCQYDRLNIELGHIPKDTYIKRFIELDQRGYVWKDKVYQQLAAEFEVKEITWEELLQDYLSQFKNHCMPFPNLKKMLEGLKSQNLLLGMITNGFGQFQMDNLKSLQIEKYFDVILVSEWEGIKKPDPRIFNKALNILNVQANEAIFVGDHPENDVLAAKKVGMKGIWKKDLHWRNAEADLIVDDLGELPFIIEKLMKE